MRGGEEEGKEKKEKKEEEEKLHRVRKKRGGARALTCVDAAGTAAPCTAAAPLFGSVPSGLRCAIFSAPAELPSLPA